MSWAMNLAPIPPKVAGRPSPSSCMHVLLGLANHAGPDGEDAFAAVSTLMIYTQLSERQVRSCLDRLEEVGLIQRGNPRVVAARIERADRRPQNWDLQMQLVRGVEQMVPSYARRRYPPAQSARPVLSRPPRASKRGAGTAPRGADGVQPLHGRGAGSAPEPSMNHPTKPPSAPRSPGGTSGQEEAESLDRAAPGNPSHRAVALINALDCRRLRRPGKRDVHELATCVDQAVELGLSWQEITDHCHRVAASARTSVVGALRTYLRPDNLPASQQRRKPTWCGECDERTRQHELATGALARCGTCHPHTVAALAGVG